MCYLPSSASCITYSRALRAPVPLVLHSICAPVPHVSHFIRDLVPYMPCFLHALVSHVLHALCALMPHVSYVLFYLTCLVPCVFSCCPCLVPYVLFSSSYFTYLRCLKTSILICISWLLVFISCGSCVLMLKLFDFFFGLD